MTTLMSNERFRVQRGNAAMPTLIFVLFVALVVIGTWAAYHYGSDHLIIDGRTIDELEPWEVAGGVVIGIFGAIFGLMMGVVGLIFGVVMMMVSLVLGLVGIAAGLFVTAGVLLGPFLLLAAILLLLRRNRTEAATPAAGPSVPADDTAKYWT